MALHPKNFNGQDRLQPGARGETFNANMPGYRGQEDRVNRTNNKLNTSAHDVPNIKYQFDYRLPVLFRYGYAYGFNQIVIPKGRIVAVDPHMDLVDFDMKKQHNTLTLANGGVPVKIREASDAYDSKGSGETNLVASDAKGKTLNGVGKEYAPLVGMDKAYSALAFRPFIDNSLETGDFTAASKQLGTNVVNTETGKVQDASGVATDNIRVGNVPVGMLQRNEYTRDDDAYNGMMPGPVLTDALVELPWFGFKNKAEENAWGSAYGGLFPGALVKSDENGRVTLSPLSLEGEMANMSIQEYEAERQQVIGQVYAVNKELLPEGAAKWATWALEDRLKYEGFNPLTHRSNNRRGEDAINNSPHNSTNQYPGYPYDKAYKDSDLHMLGQKGAGRADNYDQRMNQEFQYDNLGIPGLTDGKNVAKREVAPVTVGRLNKAGDGQDYVDMFFRAPDVDVENMTISVGVNAAVAATVGQEVVSGLKVKYANGLQGIIVLECSNKTSLDAILTEALEVKIGYTKRGLAGVPTFMDWDGVIGSVKVLLTK